MPEDVFDVDTSFRLFDFNIFDEKRQEDDDADNDADNDADTRGEKNTRKTRSLLRFKCSV